MSRGPDGPEDVDAAFAEIVAGLEREGLGSFLTEEDPPTETGPTPPTEPAADKPQATTAEVSGWRTSSQDWASASDDEHYVPPEPPPFPRPRAGTVVGMLLIAIGLLLLIVPTIIGLGSRIGTPLGLVALAAGIGWLVLRIRHGSSSDHGEHGDGAQI